MATATARSSDIIELDTHDGEHEPDIHSVTSDQSIARINDVGATSPSAESTVPDGGFGWIIVLGCAVQTFIFYGTYPVHIPYIQAQPFRFVKRLCLMIFPDISMIHSQYRHNEQLGRPPGGVGRPGHCWRGHAFLRGVSDRYMRCNPGPCRSENSSTFGFENYLHTRYIAPCGRAATQWLYDK